MRIKKLLFLCLNIINCTTFCMKKEVIKKEKPIKIAFFFQEDSKINKEEINSIEKNLPHAITYSLICSLDQDIDIIYTNSSLIRSLFYLENNKSSFKEHTKNFNKIKKNFYIYKNKNAKIAVLILQKSKKKLKEFLISKNFKENKEDSDYLIPIKCNNIKELFNHFRKRYYNESFIDELLSILPDNSSTDSIAYISGHGCKSIIADLTIKEYIKLISKLKHMRCLFLYIYSCFSGGENSVTVHSQLKTNHFPIVHRAPIDAGFGTASPDFNGYYKNINMFFDKNDTFNKNILHNKLVKEALNCINGLNYKMDFKKNNILTKLGLFLYELTICSKYFLDKTNSIPNTIMFFASFIFSLIIIEKGLNRWNQELINNKSYIEHNKNKLACVLSAYLPYDKNKKDYPSQNFFILDNHTVMIIDNPLLIKNELQGIDHTPKETIIGEPKKLKFEKRPLIVKDKDFLLIKSIIINNTIKIEGSKMPVCYSAIQGNAYHYIEKIEAKNITLKQLQRSFLHNKTYPTKLFVIGKIICKNFDQSGILHPKNKNLDSKKEDLIITNCFIYIKKTIKKEEWTIGFKFAIMRNSNIIFMDFKNLNEFREIFEKAYLHSPPLFTIDSNALYMSNNSKAAVENFTDKIDKIFKNPKGNIKPEENIVVKNDKKEDNIKKQNWYQRHKKKLAILGIGVSTTIFAISFWLAK